MRDLAVASITHITTNHTPLQSQSPRQNKCQQTAISVLQMHTSTERRHIRASHSTPWDFVYSYITHLKKNRQHNEATLFETIFREIKGQPHSEEILRTFISISDKLRNTMVHGYMVAFRTHCQPFGYPMLQKLSCNPLCFQEYLKLTIVWKWPILLNGYDMSQKEIECILSHPFIFQKTGQFSYRILQQILQTPGLVNACIDAYDRNIPSYTIFFLIHLDPELAMKCLAFTHNSSVRSILNTAYEITKTDLAHLVNLLEETSSECIKITEAMIQIYPSSGLTIIKLVTKCYQARFDKLMFDLWREFSASPYVIGFIDKALSYPQWHESLQEWLDLKMQHPHEALEIAKVASLLLAPSKELLQNLIGLALNNKSLFYDVLKDFFHHHNTFLLCMSVGTLAWPTPQFSCTRLVAVRNWAHQHISETYTITTLLKSCDYASLYHDTRIPNNIWNCINTISDQLKTILGMMYLSSQTKLLYLSQAIKAQQPFVNLPFQNSRAVSYNKGVIAQGIHNPLYPSVNTLRLPSIAPQPCSIFFNYSEQERYNVHQQDVVQTISQALLTPEGYLGAYSILHMNQLLNRWNIPEDYKEHMTNVLNHIAGSPSLLQSIQEFRSFTPHPKAATLLRLYWGLHQNHPIRGHLLISTVLCCLLTYNRQCDTIGCCIGTSALTYIKTKPQLFLKLFKAVLIDGKVSYRQGNLTITSHMNLNLPMAQMSTHIKLTDKHEIDTGQNYKKFIWDHPGVRRMAAFLGIYQMQIPNWVKDSLSKCFKVFSGTLTTNYQIEIEELVHQLSQNSRFYTNTLPRDVGHLCRLAFQAPSTCPLSHVMEGVLLGMEGNTKNILIKTAQETVNTSLGYIFNSNLNNPILLKTINKLSDVFFRSIQKNLEYIYDFESLALDGIRGGLKLIDNSQNDSTIPRYILKESAFISAFWDNIQTSFFQINSEEPYRSDSEAQQVLQELDGMFKDDIRQNARLNGIRDNFRQHKRFLPWNTISGGNNSELMKVIAKFDGTVSCERRYFAEAPCDLLPLLVEFVYYYRPGAKENKKYVLTMPSHSLIITLNHPCLTKLLNAASAYNFIHTECAVMPESSEWIISEEAYHKLIRDISGRLHSTLVKAWLDEFNTFTPLSISRLRITLFEKLVQFYKNTAYVINRLMPHVDTLLFFSLSESAKSKIVFLPFMDTNWLMENETIYFALVNMPWNQWQLWKYRGDNTPLCCSPNEENFLPNHPYVVYYQ